MSKYLGNWLPSYLRRTAGSPFRTNRAGCAQAPVHIIFLFVDHFELAGKPPRLDEWLSKYPVLASRHADCHGNRPKHTWFYAMDLMRERELVELKGLVESNLGEVELHWHHRHDDSESFLRKLDEGIAAFQRQGFLLPHDKSRKATFAFIHGDWSLDNSRGDDYCGVDNEIELLSREGCYGDFTFPALFTASQPATINSIYYVIDDEQPKSYERGRAARVGAAPKEDEFMIFQGPLTINWRDWRFGWHPMFEDGEIGRSNTHHEPKRIDSWIAQGIGVAGRPDWVFVKTFCHGGQDYESVLGASTDRMFSYLEENYNDGVRYKLHYVTAREAYNMVRAAEDGKTGDPDAYRDYAIAHPLAR